MAIVPSVYREIPDAYLQSPSQRIHSERRQGSMNLPRKSPTDSFRDNKRKPCVCQGSNNIKEAMPQCFHHVRVVYSLNCTIPEWSMFIRPPKPKRDHYIPGTSSRLECLASWVWTIQTMVCLMPHITHLQSDNRPNNNRWPLP